MTEQTWTITPEQRQDIVDQIGVGNILSISGGRVIALRDGIELPVSNGFRVRVHYSPTDVYTVERIFRRGGREFQHGTQDEVYCDQVGEAAYRAGMFRSFDKTEWPSWS